MSFENYTLKISNHMSQETMSYNKKIASTVCIDSVFTIGVNQLTHWSLGDMDAILKM